MMIAAVGSSLKVMGMRSAVPAAGPNPGRTPIRVPRMQPIVANKRFMGVSAVAKPVIRCCNASNCCLPHSNDAEKSGRQRHLQQSEQVAGAETADDGQRQREPPG